MRRTRRQLLKSNRPIGHGMHAASQAKATRRHTPVARMLAIACLLANASAAARAEVEASWAVYDHRCTVAGESLLEIGAGNFGVFYFDLQPASEEKWKPPCPEPRAYGRDSLGIYPHPGPAPVEIDCEEGDACTLRPGDISGFWVAYVDWNTWHGRAVDQVIRGATDTQVRPVLVPLDSQVLGSPGVTDVDLVHSLASLAEAVDNGATPPLVISMSLGRPASANDAQSVQCPSGRLSCQIALLLAHLAQPAGSIEPRSVLVAAAGNHRSPLFPASLRHVLSVGNIDLANWRSNGSMQISWETPQGTDFPQAMMPGSAMCIPVSSGGQPRTLRVPAGSSFAVAFFAGWIADALLWRPSEVRSHLDGSAGWVPRSMCAGSVTCPFELAHGSTAFPSVQGRASETLIGLLTTMMNDCDSVLDSESPQRLLRAGSYLSIAVRAVLPGDDPFQFPSVADRMASRIGPAPEPDPCVPCILCCQAQIQPQVTRSHQPPDRAPELLEEPTSHSAGMRFALLNLVIDLSAGWPLPQGVEIEAVYLRMSQELLRLRLSAQNLLSLRDGQVATLRLHGPVLNTDLSQQPTMVFLLSAPSATGGRDLFWDATPVVPTMD